MDRPSFIFQSISQKIRLAPSALAPLPPQAKNALESQDSVGVPPLKVNGKLYSSSRREKANILNDQFKSVFTTENLRDFPAIGISNMPGMGRNTVTTKSISNLLA